MSFLETLVILLVAVIVLGPKRLPAAARKVGHWMGMARRASDEFKRQLMTMDQAMERSLNSADDTLDRLVPDEVTSTLEEVREAVSWEEPPAASPDDLWDAEPVPGGLPPEPTPADATPPPTPEASSAEAAPRVRTTPTTDSAEVRHG